MISLESLRFISITKTKDLEPDGATTESAASKEGKDGMSSGTGNVQWDDVKKCAEGMAPYEKGKVDPSTGDMDASILLLGTDEACFELRC